MNDPRDPTRITYSLRHLLTLPIMMFLGHTKSRHQLDRQLESPCLIANLASLIGEDLHYTARADTMNYLLEQLNPEMGTIPLASLPALLVKQLLKKRMLERFRFNHEYLVAVDATELFRLHERHCKCCLTAEYSNGQTDYFHNVLEAKLVSVEGLALSLASEFIENDGPYVKQDCEIKAAYRLLAELKRQFPRLRICLTGDSLYACQEILQICFDSQWGFMLVFKPGRMPAFYEEVTEKLRRLPDQRLQRRHDDGTSLTYSWVTNLSYRGHTLHAIFLDIVSPDGTTSRHAYLTDHRPSADTIEHLINHGGRQRHKIENQGFNTQKNGGYELEHDYGHCGYAWKNYYYLIQVVHLLHQLMLNTELFGKLAQQLACQHPNLNLRVLAFWLETYRTARQAAGGLKHFAATLGEHLRQQLLDAVALDTTFANSFQMRFNFDTS